MEIRLVQELPGRALEREAAHFQDQRTIGEVERAPHVLLDHQHGGAGIGERAKEPEDLLADEWRKTDRRLVDEEHARTQEQRPADLELLLLASGKRRRLVVQPLA